MGKPPDEFDNFLEVQRPLKSRVCETCKHPVWSELTKRYQARLDAHKPSPTLPQVWRLLTEKYGYNLTLSTLQVHMRRCLRDGNAARK